MQIRSLVRVRLTKYFPSDRYIINRCPGADAILIDMEKHPGNRMDDYKLSSFLKLRDSDFKLPKLFVDSVVNTFNPWIPRLLREKSIDGMAMRNEVSSEDTDSWDNTVFTVIWDAKEQRVTHSIISYHRINDGDILWNSSIRTAVQGSLEHNIQPLAARTLRFRDMETATQEFEILRQIGFTGAVIRNPNLIEMTNKVFQK